MSNVGDTVHRLVQDRYLDTGRVLEVVGTALVVVEWTTDEGVSMVETHTQQELDDIYPWGK